MGMCRACFVFEISAGTVAIPAEWSIEDELIPGPNPLFGFEDYPETERELKIPTIEEERAMVTALLNIDLAVGVYAGFMGETAIRTEEALRLKWSSMDVGAGIATVPAEVSKTKQARHIPLSPFCKELLGMLPRVTAHPQVFVRTTTLKPVKDTRGAFSKRRVSGHVWTSIRRRSVTFE